MLEAKQNFEYFIEIQNDTGISLDGIEDAFNRLFCNSIVAATSRVQLSRRGMRTTSLPDDVTQASFTLKKCEVMDENHIEVVVCMDSESTREAWHDVLVVKDGTIVMIEPYRDVLETATRGELTRRKSSLSASRHGPATVFRREEVTRYEEWEFT